MTREEVYDACLTQLDSHNSLLMELPTGFGKTRLAIQLVNHLCDTVFEGKQTSMLLLVAKTVHKQTWKDEFNKWGGIKTGNLVVECYESLHKHHGHYDFIIADEVHHIGSELRLDLLKNLQWGYFLGLSATVPRKLQQYFKYKYHAQVVSCDLVEAIENEILPEPKILLYPLQLDNANETETIEINASAKGPIVYGKYYELWKYKRQKVHAILTCTQKQKSNEINSLIEWEKKRYMLTRSKALEQSWLYHCGKRLEFYADCKVPVVKGILKYLDKQRTITFCKTIEQCEQLGSNCIHSKNKDSSELYNKFNRKEINHVTAVNILNENANLVECKYAIFCNISSSEIIIPQRLGKL